MLNNQTIIQGEQMQERITKDYDKNLKIVKAYDMLIKAGEPDLKNNLKRAEKNLNEALDDKMDIDDALANKKDNLENLQDVTTRLIMKKDFN